MHYIRNLPENLSRSSPCSPRCCLAEYRAPVGPNFMRLPLSFPDNAITDRKPPKLDYPLYRAPALRRRR